jgi:HSP20 family protein
MKMPVKRGKPLKLWYEPWGEVWIDRVWPDFAALSYDVWVPNVNFYEKANTYNIRVELPGIDKNKIDVYLDSKTNVLTVRGIRTCTEDEEAEKCHVRESVFGPFSRRIHLPFDVQADKTEATYKDGVLTLVVPKARTPKAKKIEVTE